MQSLKVLRNLNFGLESKHNKWNRANEAFQLRKTQLAAEVIKIL